MQLSKRLYTIMQFVPKDKRVVDVGTDHGYIPIYLMKHHIAKACIATDINKGPVENAKAHIKMYGLENIDVRLGPGLSPVKMDETDIIMISGMGGYLIIDILKNDLPLVKACQKLILQPQQDSDKVRRFLHSIGFKIEDEAFVEDEGKYYTVIVAVPGVEESYKAYEYIYGKKLIEKGEPLFKEWLIKKQDRLNEIEQRIKGTYSESSQKRKQILLEEKKRHEEVMTCLF